MKYPTKVHKFIPVDVDQSYDRHRYIASGNLEELSTILTLSKVYVIETEARRRFSAEMCLAELHNYQQPENLEIITLEE